jgi:hypothetical protein
MRLLDICMGQAFYVVIFSFYGQLKHFKNTFFTLISNFVILFRCTSKNKKNILENACPKKMRLLDICMGQAFYVVIFSFYGQFQRNFNYTM